MKASHELPLLLLSAVEAQMMDTFQPYYRAQLCKQHFERIFSIFYLTMELVCCTAFSQIQLLKQNKCFFERVNVLNCDTGSRLYHSELIYVLKQVKLFLSSHSRCKDRKSINVKMDISEGLNTERR